MTVTETRWAQQQKRNIRFVSYLRSLAPDDQEQREDRMDSKNRATLAALRRGLGKEPGTAPEMYPHVEPFLPVQTSIQDETPYYLVAALFAWHQKDWPSNDRYGSNLGTSLARLRREQATERGTEVEQGDSTERRFVAMLSSTREDLPYHLRQMIGLLRTKEVPVNWLQLLSDVQQWNADSRIVQRSWASSFWGQRDQDQATDKPPESTAPIEDQPADDEATTY